MHSSLEEQRFFQCAGCIAGSETAEISIGFLNVPGVRHVALKVTNIEEAFIHIKSQPDTTLINTSSEYKVFQIGKTSPEDFYYFDKQKEADADAKTVAANILGAIKYFYFIDKYGLQWEFEQ